MKYKKWSVLLSSVLVGTVFIPSFSMAGNVKKLYVNLSKDGLQAQASDIPTNYGNIENVVKGIAYDFSGKPAIGKIQGATVVQGPDNMGKAYEVGKNSSYIQMDGIPVNTAPGGFNTVEFWMYWDGSDDYGQVFSWNGAYNLWLVSGGRLGVNTYHSDGLGAETIPRNKWTHVAVVFPNGTPSTSNVKYYLNGEKKTTTYLWGCCTSNARVATPKIRLGQDVSGETSSILSTRIDELRIWNYARTDEEIKNNYNKILTGKEQGLVGYWRFDY